MDSKGVFQWPHTNGCHNPAVGMGQRHQCTYPGPQASMSPKDARSWPREWMLHSPTPMWFVSPGFLLISLLYYSSRYPIFYIAFCTHANIMKENLERTVSIQYIPKDDEDRSRSTNATRRFWSMTITARKCLARSFQTLSESIDRSIDR